MGIKQHATLLVVAAALALVAAQGCSTGGGDEAEAPVAAGPCEAGYVVADLPWGQKCLVHGELCKQAEDAAYHEFGFHCHEDARLRRE